MNKERHGAMKGISVGLKIVAWIVLLLGLAVAIAAAVGAQQGAQMMPNQETGAALMMGVRAGGIIGAAISAVMAVTWFLVLYALADGLLLLLDIEVNTRQAAAPTAEVRTGIAAAPSPAATEPAGPPAVAPG